MVLLLLFIPLDPQLSRLFLVGDDFIQTLNTIVQLCFGQFKGFLNAHFLSFKSGRDIKLLVQLLIKLFNFSLAPIKDLIFEVDDVR